MPAEVEARHDPRQVGVAREQRCQRAFEPADLDQALAHVVGHRLLIMVEQRCCRLAGTVLEGLPGAAVGAPRRVGELVLLQLDLVRQAVRQVAEHQGLVRAEVQDHVAQVGGRRAVEAHPLRGPARHGARAAVALRAAVLACEDAFAEQAPRRASSHA